jgi:hypothetical protein
MFGGLLLLGAGCSGIHASKSVSPATFLLPGLMQTDPAPAHPDQVLPIKEPSAETLPS